MSRLSDLLERWRSIIFRAREERELDEELRHHVDLETMRQMAAGLDPREARRRAHLRLGGVEQVKEHVRAARGTRAIDELAQDVGYGLRMLGARPVFTAAVTLSLALGIGANTAIFSVLNALMWRTLPVEQPDELWTIGRSYPYREFRALAEDDTMLAAVAAYGRAPLNVNIDGGLEPTAEGQLVSGQYFSILGVAATAGRAIGPEDDRVPDGHPVAMLSDGYWSRRFGRDPSTIGRVIAISGTPFTVIGVTPPGFTGVEVGTAPDIYVPVMMQPTVMPDRENLIAGPTNVFTWLTVLARLRPGVSPEPAATSLDGRVRASFLGAVGLDPRRPAPGDPEASGRVGAMYAMADEMRPVLTPAGAGVSPLRRQSRPLYLLMLVVAVVLVIACANTANLLLARGSARRREFAVRLALGAGRWRLVRQLLVEGLLLAALGGAAGLGLAHWVADLVVAFLASGVVPVVLDIGPDLRVLAFTTAISVAAGLLFALAPSLRATRVRVTTAVTGVGSVVERPRGLRADRLLTVAQMTLSLVLLMGAGLFVRSLLAINARDDGAARDQVLIVRVEPKGSDQRGVPGTSERLDRIYRDLITRVEALPGVRSASLAQFTPTNRVGLGGRATSPSGETVRLHVPMVYPGYFRTMGIPILAGRDFEAGDLDLNVRAPGPARPGVGVVNETFARLVWPGESPLDKSCDGRSEGPLPCRIIGVVGDSPYADFTGETLATRYQPFLQTRTGRGQMALHVRIADNPAAMIPLVRREVAAIDPTLPLFQVRTLADEVDAVLIAERLMATLASAFGTIALALAAIGLYGLLSFIVVRRTSEVGLRMALGADRSDVVWLVVRDALVLIAAGVVVGLAGGAALARVAGSQISGLLFGLDALDPVSFAGATALLALVALLAAFIPARRASRVDPAVALRAE